MAKPKAKLPTFNPDSDGNYFHWILKTSAEIRRKNINGQGGGHRPLNLDPLTGRPPIRSL